MIFRSMIIAATPFVDSVHCAYVSVYTPIRRAQHTRLDIRHTLHTRLDIRRTLHTCLYIHRSDALNIRVCTRADNACVHAQTIADRVAQHLEMISKNFQFSTRRTRILIRLIIYYTHLKSHGQNSGSLEKF